VSECQDLHISSDSELTNGGKGVNDVLPDSSGSLTVVISTEKKEKGVEH